MAIKFYRKAYGMLQHPQSFAERGYPPLQPGETYPGNYRNPKDRQLIYPGDIFACEESLIEKPKSMGGMMDRKVTENKETGEFEEAFVLDALYIEPLPDYDPEEGEVWTLRDEPSAIIGINISAAQYAKRETEEESASSVVRPIPSVAKEQPAQGTRAAGATKPKPKAANPVRDAAASAGPPRVRR